MEDSIVMSTNISLSRNIDNYPFPHKLSDSESMIIINKVEGLLKASNDLNDEGLVLQTMNNISDIEKNTLMQRNLINQEFSQNQNGAIITNRDRSINILINHNDHINIKVNKTRLHLDDGYDIASGIDDVIGDKVDYAFDEEIGYLTSCPVNAGTGLKISVLLHLPILTLQDKVDNYYNIAYKIGANLKGINNNKINTLGSMYEISNQGTFGMSERNIIESIRSLTKDIVEKEITERQKLKIKSSIELEDEIFRSLGVLEKSRIISIYEAMKHLSNVKLGIEMEYINDINIEKIENLMRGLKPGLRLISTDSESDVERASYLRGEFALANRNNV